MNRQLMPDEYLWYHRTFSVDGHKTKRAGESFPEEDPESGMGADLTEERLLLSLWSCGSGVRCMGEWTADRKAYRWVSAF